MKFIENICEHAGDFVLSSKRAQFDITNKESCGAHGSDEVSYDQQMEEIRLSFERIRRKYLKNLAGTMDRAKLVIDAQQLHDDNEAEFLQKSARNKAIVNSTQLKFKWIRMENAQLEDINLNIVRENQKLRRDFDDCLKFINDDFLRKENNQELVIALLEDRVQKRREQLQEVQMQQEEDYLSLKSECERMAQLVADKRMEVCELDLEIEHLRGENVSYRDLCQTIEHSHNLEANENAQLLDSIDRNESKYFKNLLHQSFALENELRNCSGGHWEDIDYSSVLQKSRQPKAAKYEDLQRSYNAFLVTHQQKINALAALETEYENIEKTNQSIDCYIRTNRLK